MVRGVIREKSAWPSFCGAGPTVTQEWLAEKLEMRSAANVSQLLRRAVVKRRNRQVPSRFADFINRTTQAAEGEREYVKICTLTPNSIRFQMVPGAWWDLVVHSNRSAEALETLTSHQPLFRAQAL
jgi:hypothetical protein